MLCRVAQHFLVPITYFDTTYMGEGGRPRKILKKTGWTESMVAQRHFLVARMELLYENTELATTSTSQRQPCFRLFIPRWPI